MHPGRAEPEEDGEEESRVEAIERKAEMGTESEIQMEGRENSKMRRGGIERAEKEVETDTEERLGGETVCKE